MVKVPKGAQLTRREAASRAAVSVYTVDRWIERKLLTVVRYNRRLLRIPEESLEKLIASRMVPSILEKK